jgi:two-component system response regulator LytT
LKALVVDDEPLVRSELTYTLQSVARGCLVREADSGREALDLLQRSDFDIVFLDIHMPELTGIEAAEAIKHLPTRPYVVFVTAHENYALAAFDVAASDYLLKPVTRERLTETLERLGIFARDAALSKALMMGRLVVQLGDRRLLVPIEDVRFVQVRGHQVSVALYDEAARLRGTLGGVEERLEAHGFVRAHRAYIVNPQHVVEFVPFAGGTYALHMDDRARSEVPVSRHFASAVRAAVEAVGRGALGERDARRQRQKAPPPPSATS